MQTSNTIPLTQKAIIQHEAGALQATSGLSVPEINPWEMLVRVVVVGLNPCDFKMPLRFPTPGLWDGCDFAGTVVLLGDKVAKEGHFCLGDRVSGAVQGSNQAEPTSGAFCEYVKANPGYTFKIPEEMSFSASLGISGTGIATLGVALFWSLRVPGALDHPASRAEDIFIYGGSSTVGLLAIQMAKLCGHRVITTCSPHNFDLVRSYGADLVFDYHLSSCAKEIRTATKNALRFVVDPFCEIKTMSLCHEAVGRMGGRYCALEQYKSELCVRKTIKHELIMGGAIAGKGVDLPEPYGIPPRPEIADWAVNWYPVVENLIQTGKLRPVPVEEVQPAGFEGILAGLEQLQKGVSGRKLVVSLI